MDNVTGNLSTILKFIVMVIAPYLAVYGIDQSTLYAVLSAVVGLVLAYVDAKYPNSMSFLGNAVSDDEAIEE